jgi:hypothetical protein
LIVFPQIGVESFFFGCCLNISAQLDILRESFDGDKKKFVEEHFQLLELTKELNHIFKPILFFIFLLISSLLCGLGFQLVVLQNIGDRIVVAIFGTTIIIKFFFYSYGGQLIVNRSELIAQNFYNCDRDFLIMIAMPLKTNAIKSAFYTADLPTFLNVLRSAGSLITLLKSLIK